MCAHAHPVTNLWSSVHTPGADSPMRWAGSCSEGSLLQTTISIQVSGCWLADSRYVHNRQVTHQPRFVTGSVQLAFGKTGCKGTRPGWSHGLGRLISKLLLRSIARIGVVASRETFRRSRNLPPLAVRQSVASAFWDARQNSTALAHAPGFARTRYYGSTPDLALLSCFNTGAP